MIIKTREINISTMLITKLDFILISPVFQLIFFFCSKVQSKMQNCIYLFVKTNMQMKEI